MIVRASRSVEGVITLIMEPETNLEMAQAETLLGWAGDNAKRHVVVDSGNMGSRVEYQVTIR